MRIRRASQYSVLLAAASFALYAAPASAAIIDSPDHTFLTDSATGLDWLDVTTTAGMSFSYVSSQLSAGGQFAGWHYATGDQLNALVSNYSGVAIAAGFYGQVNMEPDHVDGLVTLLGSTLDSYMLANYGVTWDSASGYAEGQGIDYTYGILADAYTPNPDWRRTAIIYDDDRSPFHADLFWGGDYGAVSPADTYGNVGSFLVRDQIAAPVPEPETYAMLLAGLGLIGLTARRRKQKLSA